jgi:TolB protein
LKVRRLFRNALVGACLASAILVVEPAQAAFPGKNGRIVFAANTKLANQAIYSINPDGTELRQVAGGVFQAGSPSFSSDGREIAFEGTPGPNSRAVYRMNSDGSARTTIVSGTDYVVHPFWFRDDRIGFMSTLGNRPGWNVEVIRRTGEGRQVLFSSSKPTPSWRLSPDDSTFATTEGTCNGPAPQGCSSQLKLLNLDGSLRSAVPLPFVGSEYIQWSPDGTKLALTGYPVTGENRELFIINADGTGARRLTTGGDPAWSPDGRQILFTRFEPGQHLYVINVDGSGERLVLGGRWRVFGPDWGSASLLPPSPSMTITVGKGQRLRKALRGSATCELDCKVRVGATISIKRANRVFKTRRVKLELLANKKESFGLKFSRYAAKAIQRLAKGRGRLKVTIAAVGKDVAGAPVSAQKTIRVRR